MHSFYLNDFKRSSFKRFAPPSSFEAISEATDGMSQELDVSSKGASQKLTDAVNMHVYDAVVRGWR